MQKAAITAKARKPFQVIAWSDTENTGATGWIVIDRLVNGVSGGGLFMHAGATLTEVADLARTMSMKNALQHPIFGGGKGGIRFDHRDPRAAEVLRRFLIDNRETIEHYWCTGADLNTDNNVIHKIIREDLGLESGFHCLGNMLRDSLGLESQAGSMLERIGEPANQYFRLAESATGFSVSRCLRNYSRQEMPSIVIQGFGAVGKSLAYYIWKHNLGIITAICEADGFICDENGIDVLGLLEKSQNTGSGAAGSSLCQSLTPDLRARYSWTERNAGEDNDAYLVRFLSGIRADIFCPCAGRYGITGGVLQTLTDLTFSASDGPMIVCGANNVFSSPEVFRNAGQTGILLLPEWLSNCGNALLFLEAMKTKETGREWVKTVFREIDNRLTEVFDAAKVLEANKLWSVYDCCHKVVADRLEEVLEHGKFTLGN